MSCIHAVVLHPMQVEWGSWWMYTHCTRSISCVSFGISFISSLVHHNHSFVFLVRFTGNSRIKSCDGWVLMHGGYWCRNWPEPSSWSDETVGLCSAVPSFISSYCTVILLLLKALAVFSLTSEFATLGLL